MESAGFIDIDFELVINNNERVGTSYDPEYSLVYLLCNRACTYDRSLD